MRIRDLMTPNVVTVRLDDKVTDVQHMMNLKKIRRVPIVENGKVIGIVTTTDMDRVSPSEATTLSKYELIYLWSKVTIKDALPRYQKLITIGPDQYIEEAAQLMNEHHIGALPVMENDQLVGIITESNIFDGLIKLMRVKQPHTRIDIRVTDQIGTLADITALIAKAGRNLLNSSVYEDSEDVYRLMLRIEGHDNDDIVAELATKYEIVATKKMG